MSTRRILSPRGRRLIRSYGLVVLIAIGFLILAIVVSTVDRAEPAGQSLSRPGAIA